MRNSNAFDKMYRVALPHPLLEILGIIFLHTELNKSTFVREEMVLYTLFATNKANIYSIGIFRVPAVAHFMVKV